MDYIYSCQVVDGKHVAQITENGKVVDTSKSFDAKIDAQRIRDRAREDGVKSFADIGKDAARAAAPVPEPAPAPRPAPPVPVRQPPLQPASSTMKPPGATPAHVPPKAPADTPKPFAHTRKGKTK